MHEKSILLPLLPAALLALDEPRLLRVFGPLAALSMFPLLRFERLGPAYAACQAALALLGAAPTGAAAGKPALPGSVWLCWSAVAALGAAALHGAYALPAPPALPHLHAAGVSAFAAAHFVAVALYANWRQWQLPADAAPPARAQPQPRQPRRRDKAA